MRVLGHDLSMKVAALVLSVLLTSLCSSSAQGKIVYDEAADGFQQIANAQVVAKVEKKRLLIVFGANWCGWCHKLHEIFEKNEAIAKELKQHFVVVEIDIDGQHNAEVDAKYDIPADYGIPAIVFADAEGKKLGDQDTGDLEDGGKHSPEKVLAMLRKWAPIAGGVR